MKFDVTREWIMRDSVEVEAETVEAALDKAAEMDLTFCGYEQGTMEFPYVEDEEGTEYEVD